MESLLNWIEQNNWVIHVFGVVLATVLTNFILRRILHRLHLKAEATDSLWDDTFLESAKRPMLLFVWVIGLSIAAEIVEAVSQNQLFQLTPLVRHIAIILLLVMFLVKLISNVEVSIIKKRTLIEMDADEVTVKVIGRLLRITVLITGTLVILQTLGISISGVLAFSGIGGIAVGFAAKDLLANFFGGLMIYLDRPFSIGDWVRSPDREIEGTVEDIGWRLTKIRTFDKRPLYIPNSMFNTIVVENPSRMTNRRIYETFGLRYCDSAKIGDIVADVKKMLQAHKEIDTEQTMIVNFVTLSASSLDFFVYTFTKTTNWVYFHEVKQDVLLKIIEIIHSHGADIAFPTRTLDGLDSLVPPQQWCFFTCRIVSEQGNNPAQFSLTLNKPPDDAMDDISQSNIRKLKKMGDFRFQQYGDAFVGLLIDKCQVPSLDRIDAETGQPKVWQ